MDGNLYVIKLNEYAQKNRCRPPEYEDVDFFGPDHMKSFTKRVRLNGEIFPVGEGNTKKEAKQNAAKNAFEVLSNRPAEEPTAAGSRTAETVPNVISVASGQQTDHEDDLCTKTNELSVKGKDHSLKKKSTDFISIVNTYCQKTQRTRSYTEVKREGPAHDPQFSYKLEIDNKPYPVGKGKTIKEAKQNAAELAWSALQEQTDWDSKVSVGSAASEDDTSATVSTTQSAQSTQSTLHSQSLQTSSSDWIQFKDSKTSSAQDTTQEKNSETTTSTQSRFNLTYDSIECLGNGSFGWVYKARNKVLNRFYAIKEIRCKDIRMREKSLQEVKVLSDLLHPNIVRYYTFWLEDTGYKGLPVNSKVKYLYIEMELCDGGTLKDWIEEKNTKPLQDSQRQEGLSLAQQILSGVEYIHLNKLIHRDLKPANILFGPDGKVRIGDFGLATQDNDDGEILERTEGTGTPIYMAPEQVGANYDRKVDIFALGLIFFELFWRRATGHERVKIWKNVRSQNLPKDFLVAYQVESHIIKTMLSEKPEDRPEASALTTELDKWSRTSELDQGNRTI